MKQSFFKRYIVIIVIALLVGIIWFTWGEYAVAPELLNERISGPEIAQSETALPDFAYVEMRDGERVLVNERDGYEIALEDNWRPEYYTNIIEVFVEGDYPSGELTGSFSITKSPPNNADFENIVNTWLEILNDSCIDCYKIEDRYQVNKVKIVRVKDIAALGNKYHYLFMSKDHFYELSTLNFSNEFSESLIEQVL